MYCRYNSNRCRLRKICQSKKYYQYEVRWCFSIWNFYRGPLVWVGSNCRALLHPIYSNSSASLLRLIAFLYHHQYHPPSTELFRGMIGVNALLCLWGTVELTLANVSTDVSEKPGSSFSNSWSSYKLAIKRK